MTEKAMAATQEDRFMQNDVLTSLVTPFRQAQRVLGQATEVARSLADDTWFDRWVDALSSLPNAATFNPLQAAQTLPVSHAGVSTEGAEAGAAAAHRQFLDALRAQAKQQRGAITPPWGRPASLTPATPEEKHTQHGRYASGAASTLAKDARPAKDKGVAVSPQANASRASRFAAITDPLNDLQHDAMQWVGRHASAPIAQVMQHSLHTTLGSWGVLERIADLVDWLEPPASDQRSDHPSPKRDAAARGNAGETAVNRRRTSHQRHGAQGEQTAAARLALRGLADAAWGASTATGRRGEGVGSRTTETRNAYAESHRHPVAQVGGGVPAPRSPSLLNPQGASRGHTNSSAAASGDGVSGSERTSQPALNVINEEDLAERLNRALIEQAWRGGVDLT